MTRKEFQLCGIGNALVDIFLDVSHQDLDQLKVEGRLKPLLELSEQQHLLERFQKSEARLASGGSVANSTIAFAQLGGQAAFIGCVGDDRYGLFYANEFAELGIDFGNPALLGETTGTCVCLITPDAERTMCVSLGVARHLAARHVHEQRLATSEWLFIEGYVLANPETGQGAARTAVQVARQHGTKVALTCSDAFIINVFGDAFREILSQSDLLFCNASEAAAITGASGPAESFARLKTLVPSTIVTDGPHGAYVRHAGVEAHVPAYSCTPVDLTGAGDMLAGGFLYGLTHGIPPDKAARAACFLAMKVITQVGARLHHGVRQFWDEAMANC
jgi:sugar/nucleoside kinase (ribokinase family)